MHADELAFLELTELARLIATRAVSPVEVTQAQLARIETRDGRYASYVAVLGDAALAAARAAEAELQRGVCRGPLHGVPVAVKDLCDLAGAATVAGMPRVRADAMAASDATVVARLRAAGAVILGKLQLTEGALAHHHPDVRVPVNPHHPGYWSGASSSGTGVAVAAGLAYAALGSDTGGSIRFPAYANGVTGLKPTWGRVSRAGVFPLAPSLDHIGPLARSSADCAAVLGAIAGADGADPTALASPVPDYLAALDGSARGLTIGYDEDYAIRDVAPDIVRALTEALAVFDTAGATIVPVRMPATAAVVEAWTPLCMAEAAAVHAATYPARATDYGPQLAALLEAGRATSGIDYAQAHTRRLDFRGALARVFATVDVVLAPACMRHNFTLEAFARFGERAEDWPELLRYTAPYDIAGTPTLSLPAGVNADGAPFGIQLLGGHLGEAALLRAGHAYQLQTAFHRRRPG